jgi:hypothetical protein
MGIVHPSSIKSLLIAYPGEDECRSALPEFCFRCEFRDPSAAVEALPATW